MAVRGRQMVPSTASRVLIRIEDPGGMSGLLYNPYMDASRRFTDVVDLTDKLDDMFDTLSFPQATMEYRRFEGPKKKKRAQSAPEQMEKPEGKVGTDQVEKHEKLTPQDSDVFIVHVQFRQNASWQGTIKWAGSGEEKRFRSTLELLKIMDSALAANHPEDAEA